MNETIMRAKLVVIGGGGAGLCAAVTAMQNGVKDIVVLEKSHFFGGNSRMAGGHLFGPSDQKNCDVIFHTVLAANHYKVAAKNLRAFINNSKGTIDFFNSIGVPYHYGGGNANYMDNGKYPFGNFVQATRKMCTMLRENGNTLLRDTGATAIERDAEGKVCRVLAETKDGEKIVIDTEAAVVTTGGFGGSSALMHQYFPDEYDDNFFSDGLPWDGSGISVARSGGAKINQNAVMIKENAYSCESYNGAPSRAAHNVRSLWVNCMGERFADESYTRNESSNALVRQPGKVGFALFDANIIDIQGHFGEGAGTFADTMAGIEEEPVSRQGMMPPMGSSGDDETPAPPMHDNKGDMIREAKRSKDWVCIADTLEEIADWIGCDRDAFMQTVAEYNEDCASGHDRLFCKDPKFMIPLAQAPFYAIKFRPLLIDTIGPIVVNENMEAVGNDNKPVPGLYAAGVCTAGWQGNDFHPCGWALGYSTTSGRIAGKSAAEYLN